MPEKVSTALVKELRQATGAGIMASKRALEHADGDMDKAKEFLRVEGLALADAKSGRETRQGLIESYIHKSRPLGALLALGCETDFVARTDEFGALAKDLAMHIAAMDPAKVNVDDEGDGDALVDQPYFRDGSMTVGEVIGELVARTGENIQVLRFSRFELDS
jgi:elongation factor Ts